MEVKVRLSGEILHGGEENAYIYIDEFAYSPVSCLRRVRHLYVARPLRGMLMQQRTEPAIISGPLYDSSKLHTSALFLYYCLITNNVKLKYCTEVTCRCSAAARFSSERIQKISIKFCIRLFTLNLMGNI